MKYHTDDEKRELLQAFDREKKERLCSTGTILHPMVLRFLLSKRNLEGRPAELYRSLNACYVPMFFTQK